MFYTHIDTLVKEDFLFGRVLVKKGETFEFNQHNPSHRGYLMLKKITLLEPDEYDYVCNCSIMALYDNKYYYGDVIENALEIPTLKSLIEIGKIAKRFPVKAKEPLNTETKKEPLSTEKTYKQISVELGMEWKAFKKALEDNKLEVKARTTKSTDEEYKNIIELIKK